MSEHKPRLNYGDLQDITIYYQAHSKPVLVKIGKDIFYATVAVDKTTGNVVLVPGDKAS